MAGTVQEDRVVREIDVYLADHASEDNKVRRLVTARVPSHRAHGGERIGRRASFGCMLRIWCTISGGCRVLSFLHSDSPPPPIDHREVAAPRRNAA